MTNLQFCRLEHRALIRLDGADRADFLQGLVSADVTRADAATALYGAFLTPQGKFLYDFFLASSGPHLLLEVESAGREDFRQRLSRFRLRSKVSLALQDDWTVFALFGQDVAAILDLPAKAGAQRFWGGGLVMVDPRLPEAGLRAWLPDAQPLTALGCEEVSPAVWDRHRITLGLGDGRRDLVAEKTILLEAGFDELNGVDWQKGCFLGQEVTARSKYRGQIKKRLLPVAFDGPPPPPGTLIFAADQEVGETRSHSGQLGLAMIRLDALASGAELRAGGISLRPQPPSWLTLS